MATVKPRSIIIYCIWFFSLSTLISLLYNKGVKFVSLYVGIIFEPTYTILKIPSLIGNYLTVECYGLFLFIRYKCVYW